MKHLSLMLIVASNLLLTPVSNAQTFGAPRGRLHHLEYFVKRAIQRASRAKYALLLGTGTAVCMSSCATGPAPGRPGPRVSGYTQLTSYNPMTLAPVQVKTFPTGARMTSKDGGKTWESSVGIGDAVTSALPF